MAVPGREHTNHSLLDRLLLDYGTLVLRSWFDSKHHPDTLHSYLSSPTTQNTLKQLHNAGILKYRQYRVLNKRPVSSADFDMSLLALLLRNICGLKPPHSREWGRSEVWDDSIEVNIARLRDYKNKFASHPSGGASLDDATFMEFWAKTRSAIIVLGGQGYASVIDQLGNERMDLEAQNRSQEFLEIQERLDVIVDMLRENQQGGEDCVTDQDSTTGICTM